MPRIARELDRGHTGVQLILLRGKNAAVAGELQTMERRIPMFVEGFTREIPYYMELADFFIGKPGPGSISEALAKRLPVIVPRNAWTMAHERYNAAWVEEQGVGLAVRNLSTGIADAVRTLLAPGNYERFRRRAAEMRNSAVYEIPELLDAILCHRPPARTRHGARLPAASNSPPAPSLRVRARDPLPPSDAARWRAVFQVFRPGPLFRARNSA